MRGKNAQKVACMRLRQPVYRSYEGVLGHFAYAQPQIDLAEIEEIGEQLIPIDIARPVEPGARVQIPA